MGIRRLILLLVAGSSGCAGSGDVCDGGAIELRPALSEPVRETSMTCTGHLVDLCSQPTVRLEDGRCDSPQVELVPEGGDPWIALTLVVEEGRVVEALASSNAGEVSQPVAGGWLELYEGSLDDPADLSGELEIHTPDGGAVAGRFSALTNP